MALDKHKKQMILVKSIAIMAVLIMLFGSCHSPRYYTKYKYKNKDLEQHYNPYSTKWYQWTWRHKVI